MATKLTLRLAAADVCALDTAAAAIAGPAGAPFVGHLAVIRAALAAFNAQQSQPQQEAVYD